MSADTNNRLENEQPTSPEGETIDSESLFDQASLVAEGTISVPETEGTPAVPQSTENNEPASIQTDPSTSNASWMRRHKKSLAVGGLVVAVGGGALGAKVATGGSHPSSQAVAKQTPNPSATISASQAPKSTNSPSATSIPTASGGTNPELSYIQPHYNMLTTPSGTEQSAAIDGSDLPATQKQMAQELVQYGFPFAPGLDYRIDTFKAKGLDETKAEKAVFLQLVNDYLAAANTDNPNVIPKMGPGEATWDTASVKSEFTNIRNNYAFWQVVTEDTSGVRDITYKNDGSHITITGTTYLNGIRKTEEYLKDFEQDSQTNKSYLTGGEMHVDFTFVLNEQSQLTHYNFTAFNN